MEEEFDTIMRIKNRLEDEGNLIDRLVTDNFCVILFLFYLALIIGYK